MAVYNVCKNTFPSASTVVIISLLLLQSVVVVTAYDLTILHTNDLSDRMEQFDDNYARCSDDEASNGECFGGFARQATAISDIRGSEENVLLMDAGDQFQGTLWFYYYMGRATSYFMNRLGYDVMVGGGGFCVDFYA